METRILIRRPDGTEETVIRPGFLSALQQETARRQTREAGRGEILRFDLVGVEPARSMPRAGNPLYTRRTDGFRPNGVCRNCRTFCDGDCRS